MKLRRQTIYKGTLSYDHLKKYIVEVVVEQVFDEMRLIVQEHNISIMLKNMGIQKQF